MEEIPLAKSIIDDAIRYLDLLHKRKAEKDPDYYIDERMEARLRAVSSCWTKIPNDPNPTKCHKVRCYRVPTASDDDLVWPYTPRWGKNRMWHQLDRWIP